MEEMAAVISPRLLNHLEAFFPMFVIYNILQFAFLPVFLPLLILFVVCKRKYRDRIPARLGVGLAKKLGSHRPTGRTIWIHALSVGEVTSAVPLARGLRAKYPSDRIVVSVTTRTGKKVADTLLGSYVDYIIDGPIDLLPVVHRFLKYLQPDLFILVETDFWPNLLLCLQHRRIPSILVNGRVSEKSMIRYLRLRFFFQPMFQSFTCLSMQTLGDQEKMAILGVAPEKLSILGNLKFAARSLRQGHSLELLAELLPKDRMLFIAGSTHPGEEQILLDCYAQLRTTHPTLFLIVAPRDPERGIEIVNLATGHGLLAALRSAGVSSLPCDLLVLDTIGELIDFYAVADLAFVGGSLVEKGGHNPIEPAGMAIPVLFGPHMEDFIEIAEVLTLAGGAKEVHDGKEMTKMLAALLDDPDLHSRMGQAAQQCVLAQHDIIANHLLLIEKFL